MEYEIVAIRLRPYFRIPGETNENIEYIKLKTGEVLSAHDVSSKISLGQKYFYTSAGSFRTEVEVANSGGNLYIRTKANHTKQDNLLNLQKF